MTMQSLYFKEQVGSLPSPSPGPWWSGLVTQSAYVDSLGQLKSISSMSHPSSTKQVERGTDKVLEKPNATHYTVIRVLPTSDDSKSPKNGPKRLQIQASVSMQSSRPEYQRHVELGFGQPMICGEYPYDDQCYGLFSTYGTQLTGRIMLPLNLTTDEGPIFVNTKQYHAIIRRRRSRAKAEMANAHKVLKNRKPYMHHSRHLHAMRRPRGCGGRFLKTNKIIGMSETNLKMFGEGFLSQPTDSQTSEVLQSDSSNLTSPRDVTRNGSHKLGSEVTSMFSMGDLNHFPITNLRDSVISLSDMMNTGCGFVRPSSRCNLKI